MPRLFFRCLDYPIDKKKTKKEITLCWRKAHTREMERIPCTTLLYDHLQADTVFAPSFFLMRPGRLNTATSTGLGGGPIHCSLKSIKSINPRACDITIERGKLAKYIMMTGTASTAAGRNLMYMVIAARSRDRWILLYLFTVRLIFRTTIRRVFFSRNARSLTIPGAKTVYTYCH